jgi:hypothetical protein
MSRAFLLLLGLLLLPAVAAHLAGGVDATVDGVRFDLGWDPDPILAGESLTLSVAATGADGVPADALWIRIAKQDDIFFAGDLVPVDGVATIAMTLPAGTYEVTVRGAGATGHFPVQVSGSARTWQIAVASVLLCVTLLCAWLIARKKK